MTTIENLNVFDFEAMAILEAKELERDCNSPHHIIDIKKIRQMTSDIKQLDSCQDSVFTGSIVLEDSTRIDWGIITDGHGSTIALDNDKMTYERKPYLKFKQAFDALDHAAIILSDDPVTLIHQLIPDNLYPVNVGATLIMFKVVDNRVEFFSIGDSSIRMYVNGSLVYKNELHKISSEKERLRLKTQNIPYHINKDKAPLILDEDHMIMEDADRISFATFALSLSQSIGHHSKTGFEPEKKTIEFESEDVIQIVLSSDGVSDMICDQVDDPFLSTVDTAAEVVEFAEKRWKKDWFNCITDKSRDTYMKHKKYREEMENLKRADMPDGKTYYEYEKTKFPQYDDISCIVWSQR
jgi:serine/threonine protein phosphatase PrpC